MNKKPLEPGVLNKFLVDTYYAKNPNVSILDPFQRLRLFVQMHYENYPNPPHDLPTQHLIGANAMIKALTEDQKKMLWNLFADPDYTKEIQDIFNRSKEQFRQDLKDELKYMALYEKVNTDNSSRVYQFEDIVKLIL